MNEEIKEMGKFACIVCEHCGTDEKGGFRCGAGVNQDVCGLCQDLGKSFYDAGYYKTKAKTNGDKIRSMSDEELARLCSCLYWGCYNDDGIKYRSILTGKIYANFNEAYKANLEWLKKI